MPTSPRPHDAARDHALNLMARHPLIDAHNDLPWVVRAARKPDLDAYDLEKVHPATDTDIPRLREGRVAAQVLAAFLPSRISHPATVTLEQIDLVLRIEERYRETFHPIRSPADIEKASTAGRIGSIISVEGTVGLEGSLAPLRIWQRLGVRLVTLCHNETLPWVDSATDAPSGAHRGLSDFGASMIAELNRLAMIVDLAHVAPHAMHAVLDATSVPLVISHSNAFALCAHPRNTPDDVLERIPANGGLIMATFVPEFLNPASWRAVQPYKDAHGKTRADIGHGDLRAARRACIEAWSKDGIDYVADHLAYLRAKVGEDHIGIGSDFYGGPNPPGLEDVSKYPDLIAELVRRGWSDASLAKLMGGNLLRVWREVEARAADTGRPNGV